MEPTEVVRSIVSNLSGLPPDQLRAGLILDEIKLRGSIKRARLDAELRKRLKATFPAAYSARTLGELEDRVLGRPATAPSPGSSAARPAAVAAPEPQNAGAGERSPAAESAAPLACGIDLEMVGNLPAVPDYWEDSFYSGSFSPAEIAYCSLQTDPKIHFAARWAAKEALKKCDNSLLSADMSQLELVRGARGQVSFAQLSGGTSIPLPHAVSVTHTDVFAAAVVVRLPSSVSRSDAQAEAAARLAAALQERQSG